MKRSIEVAKLVSEVSMLTKQNMFKVFDTMGITPPQGMLIGMLSKHGKLMISELSNKLGLSNSTVSGIIDRLERQEIAVRIRSMEDRRIVYVDLSDEFRKKHKGFHQKAEENLENILSEGTDEELDKIMEGLNMLKKLLKPVK